MAPDFREPARGHAQEPSSDVQGGWRMIEVAGRISRRKWLRRAALALSGGAVGTFAYARWIEPHWLELVHRDLPLAGLPAQWHGRRLVHLSDIHLGPQVSDEFITTAFARVTELAPDVVVVTGDYVTVKAPRNLPADWLRRVYSQLPHGRRATLGVLGNHDYGRAWQDARCASDVVARLPGFTQECP